MISALAADRVTPPELSVGRRRADLELVGREREALVFEIKDKEGGGIEGRGMGEGMGGLP